jgi:hypothetical protein
MCTTPHKVLSPTTDSCTMHNLTADSGHGETPTQGVGGKNLYQRHLYQPESQMTVSKVKPL